MKNRLDIHITDKAKHVIDAACLDFKKRFGMSCIAAFVIIERKLNPQIGDDRLSIAFYREDQRKELGDDVMLVDGIELVIAVSVQNEEIFQGRTIDIVGKSFVLS